MTSAISSPEGQTLEAESPEAAQERAEFGITRSRVDNFYWREFCYSSLNDAVAQAKRAEFKGSPDKSGSATGRETDDEMMAYGITRVPVDYFYYGAFRYTKQNDAVAQARLQSGRSKA